MPHSLLPEMNTTEFQSQFYLLGLRYHGVNNNCGISNKAGKSKFRLLSVEYRMLNRDSDQHQVEDVEEEVRGGRSKSSIKADGLLWLHCPGGATG